MTTDTAQACPSALQVTADITVPCALPVTHAQSATAAYHQAAYDGRVYVWIDRDAKLIEVMRSIGHHEQCDRGAAALAVIVTPESGPVTYEVTP